MDKIDHMTDTAVLAELGQRLAQLAKEAGVSKRTLLRLEAGESTQLTNLIRIVRALGLLGNLDVFVPAPLPSPIEQFHREGKKRKRASPRTGTDEAQSGWAWGDDEPDGDQW